MRAMLIEIVLIFLLIPVCLCLSFPGFGLSLSGGGSRAWSASYGAIVGLREISGAISVDECMNAFDAISCVSGGCWFLGQAAYYTEVHDQLNGKLSGTPSDANAVLDYVSVWNKRFITSYHEKSGFLRSKSGVEMIEFVKRATTGDGWLGWTEDMVLKTTPGNVARSPNDPLLDTTLIFGWNLLRNGHSGEETGQGGLTYHKQYFLNPNSGSSVYDNGIAGIPGRTVVTQTSKNIETSVPAFGDYVNLQIKNPKALCGAVCPSCGASKDGCKDQNITKQVVIDAIGAKPSVVRWMAYASAAVGLLSSPTLTDYALGLPENLELSSYLFSDLKNAAIPAQISGTYSADNPSASQNLRVIDGGYIDNTGIANLISKLQKKNGLETTLRLIALVSSTSGVTGNRNSDFDRLFLGSPQFTPLKTMFGEVKDFPMGNITIFDRQVTDLPAASVVPNVTQTSWLYLPGLKTIKNGLFGVQANSTVNMYVIFLNNDVAAVTTTGTVPSYRCVAKNAYIAAIKAPDLLKLSGYPFPEALTDVEESQHCLDILTSGVIRKARLFMVIVLVAVAITQI